MDAKELQQTKQNLIDEIEDLKESLIHLLTCNDIRDINLINYHYEINNKLNKIEQIDNELFNLKLFE